MWQESESGSESDGAATGVGVALPVAGLGRQGSDRLARHSVTERPASGILYTWYMVVQGGMYRLEPVRTLLATWRYEKPQNGHGTYQYYVLTRTLEILGSVHTGMYLPARAGHPARQRMGP